MRSPSTSSTTSTRCSSTRGPATAPSFVTWPISTIVMPCSLATRSSRPAASRTWATEPGAEARSAVHSVCTESTTATAGRSAASVAITTSRSVSATTAIRPAPPMRSARRRTWAGDSSPATSSTGARAAMRASAIVSSVDLPTPGSPPTSTSEPGTRPPPSTRSSSPTPVSRRSASAAGTSASATGRRGSAPPPPRRFSVVACSSTSDDHAPQEGQRPCHLTCAAPHSWQAKRVSARTAIGRATVAPASDGTIPPPCSPSPSPRPVAGPGPRSTSCPTPSRGPARCACASAPRP